MEQTNAELGVSHNGTGVVKTIGKTFFVVKSPFDDAREGSLFNRYKMKANERLLLSAPDLLDALELALTRLDINQSADLVAYEKGMAAIAKAKGTNR